MGKYSFEGLHRQDTRYGYSAGRLAVLEKSILDKSAYRELVLARDVEEMLKLLEGRHWFRRRSGNSNISWEDILDAEFDFVYNLVCELAPKRDVLDIFFLKYSFHNLKVRLKEEFAGKKTDTPLFGIGPVLLEKTSVDRFQDIDRALDKEYFNSLMREVERHKIPLFENLVKTWIDLANIKLFFRFKAMQRDGNSLSGFLFANGNLEQGFYIGIYDLKPDDLRKEIRNNYYADLFLTGIKCLDELERLCDMFILRCFNETRYIVFGIEPLIRYLLCKENEVRILRMIFIGKENNVPQNEIEEKIAGYYV